MVIAGARDLAGAGEASRAVLRRQAIATMVGNWRGTSTVPTPSLYPHQWSWDSALNAVGWSHISAGRSWAELSALLGAQWADGRVPHIVFDPAVAEDAYFPGPWFWRPLPADGPPPTVMTSGLVQPPVHAGAALTVARRRPGPASAEALARLYPRLARWHDYLWRRRRVDGLGLLAILHPWESGLDNSPAWDTALHAVVPVDVAATAAHRRDLLHAGAEHRPTDEDYARYAFLARDYRDDGYADRLHERPFCVVDPLFNAVFAWSEEALAVAALTVGADPEVHLRRAETITALSQQHLWEPALGCFVSLDVRTGGRRAVRTVGGLVPLLLPGLNDRIRAALLDTLRGPSFGLGAASTGVPSYDLTAPDVDLARYWRGPTWASTNWLVWLGLGRQGATEEAAWLARDMVDLVAGAGLREYFDPADGAGLGGQDFTWTAALLLDVLHATGPMPAR